MANHKQKQIRIAMITGVLGKGGAEKQLFYIISAMKRLNFQVKVFTLTKGEHYEKKLSTIGVECVWIGKLSSPILRLLILMINMIRLKPQIIYSTHFYGNIYAGLMGRILGILSIGSIRNDLTFELKKNSFWGRWLIKWPHFLIANSFNAVNQLISLGEHANKIIFLQNFIDLSEFDQLVKMKVNPPGKIDQVKIILVARLVEQKRIDRFIEIIASLCKKHTNILGLIVGVGPEKQRLHQKTIDLNLSSSHLLFWGQEENIPALLKKCDLLVLTSEHEGFPNVILEGMAANLPIVTTDVGDTKNIVKDRISGFVLSGADTSDFVEKIEILLASKKIREELGNAGRKIVENEFDIFRIDEIISEKLIQIAEIFGKKELIELLKNCRENGNQIKLMKSQ